MRRRDFMRMAGCTAGGFGIVAMAGQTTDQHLDPNRNSPKITYLL